MSYGIRPLRVIIPLMQRNRVSTITTRRQLGSDL